MTETRSTQTLTATPFLTDARGINIKHARCAHAATPQGRRQCRKAVAAIIARNAK